MTMFVDDNVLLPHTRPLWYGGKTNKLLFFKKAAIFWRVEDQAEPRDGWGEDRCRAGRDATSEKRPQETHLIPRSYFVNKQQPVALN